MKVPDMTDFSYQLYSSRNFAPVADTLSMLARLGYTQVEGFDGILSDRAQMEGLATGLRANHLTMPSAHFGLDILRDTPDRVLEIAGILGIKAVFAPYLVAELRPDDAAGWAAFGREVAELGKPVWDAGLQFGWHNHDFELADLGGVDRPLDLILQGDDRMALELDIAWVQVGGQDPFDWIARYVDRLVAAHIKDIAPVGQAVDEDGWADVGYGVMDWQGLIVDLRRTRVQYLVMEHDNPNDHERFARRSIDAARKY